ncbi:MAG: DUF5989 family protein [Patescibacteria group bacterium]
MNNIKQSVGLRFQLVRELGIFLWKQKLWWMVPMIVTLLLVGILIAFAQATPLAPFVYTLF